MTDPVTALHYAANGNVVNGEYAPAADGFNLADVSSRAELDALPAGVKGLVYLGMTDGVTSTFISTVESFAGDGKLFGFYIADEPADGLQANIKAEVDWIHANIQGAETFMVEENMSSNTSPVYVYNPANTDIDLFGLDPYPIQTNVPNGVDYGIIPLAVKEAESVGIPLSAIVPVYQTFGGGGYTTYNLPTASQEGEILATWGSVVPNPVFDYAYSWGAQNGDTALSNDPALQAVLSAHNGETARLAAPVIAITSVGGSVTQASQTISGTVDVLDAGSTVTILDGSTQIGSATVGATGNWTASVTLPNHGANVITATDTNAGGTGTSNAITLNVTVAPPPPPGAPTVALTSAGGTVSQASQTIAGTVDLADAGSTVTILDGTTAIGTALVDSSGNWTTGVTLANQGSNVLTATDANSAGTGTSDPVTLNLQSPSQGSGTAPTLTIADDALTVAGHGGTVDLGISVADPAGATNTRVIVQGLSWYETITDGLGDSFHGGNNVKIRLTEAQVDSGLTLTSYYRGTRDPVNTLTIVAKDTIDGVTAASDSQSIVVTDPPGTSSVSATDNLALLRQHMAGDFGDGSTGALQGGAASTDQDRWSAVLSASRH